MEDKSHVSMEQAMCPVCGKLFETGSILLDKYLRKSMGRHTVTGYQLCEEHKKLWDDGYVAFVVCKNAHHGTMMKMEEADRTGEVIHIRKTVADKLFNVELKHEMVFIDEEAAKKIKEMTR